MQIETQILNGYWGLLSNLNPSLKQNLIKLLSDSVSNDRSDKPDRFFESFGAWEDDRDADEIINLIRESRTFNREIESL